jgi:phage baseplate assembly protein gpV
MSSKNPALSTLADNIKQGVNNRLKELHTSMPGIVQSFDATKQTASVQPAVRRVFITREGTDEILAPSDLPILINVPVQFPRGGGFSLTFPVKKGDECLVVFAERAIDSWHKFGGVRDPNSRRFHSLSDATAFVGLSSLPNKVPNYDASNTQLKKDDGTAVISINEDSSVSVTADGDISATSQSNIKADAIANIDAIAGGNMTLECVNLSATATGTAEVTATSSATVTAPTINLNGNVVISGTLTQGGGGGGIASLKGGLEVTGTMTNNGTNIGSTHTHTQATDSGGDTEQNTGTPL